MWELAALAGVAFVVFLWADSLRAREGAVRAGRTACERHGLQLLDETVSIASLRLARDRDGGLRIARTYTFEFSDTGNNRRQGALVMLGAQLADLRMEPCRFRDGVQ